MILKERNFISAFAVLKPQKNINKHSLVSYFNKAVNKELPVFPFFCIYPIFFQSNPTSCGLVDRFSGNLGD